jgi:sugar phosphate isomerase/epimerase
MALTRRQVLAGMAAAARTAAQSRAGSAMHVRATPAICLYSQVLSKVDHVDLPMVVKGLGFDACDLSVQPGGHIPPEKVTYYLMPALEALTGAGLDVPMLTTALTSADRNAQEILGLSGFIGVPFFRAGRWAFTATSDLDPRLPMMQREIATLGGLGKANGIAMGIQNFIGDPAGATIADINRAIRPFDSRWVGFAFDSGYAAAENGPGGFAAVLEAALPRIKIVCLRDFKLSQEGDGPRKMTPCPLGEGAVEWPRLFSTLARAKFNGPISLQVDYQPKDELAAIRRDLDFVRKQVAAAYGTSGPGSSAGKGLGGE